MAVVASMFACDRPASTASHHSLEGRWLQVIPSSADKGWMELDSTGVARGQVTTYSLDETLQLTGWHRGTSIMPDGLCLEAGEASHCQHYLLVTDTLWLADGVGSVYVRDAGNRSARPSADLIRRRLVPGPPGGPPDTAVIPSAP